MNWLDVVELTLIFYCIWYMYTLRSLIDKKFKNTNNKKIRDEHNKKDKDKGANMVN